MLYGMTYDEFWNGSLDRLHDYWQSHQFEVEQRNQELWLQGIYIMEALSAMMDTKHRHNYPEKPHRITEMTESEKEEENKRKIEHMRAQLMAIKRRSDARRGAC